MVKGNSAAKPSLAVPEMPQLDFVYMLKWMLGQAPEYPFGQRHLVGFWADHLWAKHSVRVCDPAGHAERVDAIKKSGVALTEQAARSWEPAARAAAIAAAAEDAVAPPPAEAGIKGADAGDDAVVVKKETDSAGRLVVDVKQEPGVRVKQEPGVRVKQEPGVRVKQEPGNPDLLVVKEKSAAELAIAEEKARTDKIHQAFRDDMCARVWSVQGEHGQGYRVAASAVLSMMREDLKDTAYKPPTDAEIEVDSVKQCIKAKEAELATINGDLSEVHSFLKSAHEMVHEKEAEMAGMQKAVQYAQDRVQTFIRSAKRKRESAEAKEAEVQADKYRLEAMRRKVSSQMEAPGGGEILPGLRMPWSHSGNG